MAAVNIARQQLSVPFLGEPLAMLRIDDMKQILRRLWRSPGYTLIAIVTLAIGIGANSAIFSIVDGVLLKPLAFPDPARLAGVWLNAPVMGWKQVYLSPATYFTFREYNRSFEDIGLYRSDTFTVTGIAEPEQVHALQVTDGTLPLLRVRPAIGRLFTRQDDTFGNPETVLLFYGYWKQKFAGSSAVIGHSIRVDGKMRTIIGVLPQGFTFHDPKAVLVLPFQFKRSEVYLGNFSYLGIARLRPGVTIAQANADVARMLPIVFQQFKPAPGITLDMFKEAHFGPDVHALKQDVVGDVGKILWLIMGVVGVVLFTACANVANLLLVKTDSRQQELAIRMALGAERGRLGREILLESFLLSLAGGAVGLLVASLVLQLLVAIGTANLPRLQEITINIPVLLFTFGVSMFGGLLFGSASVFKYTSPRIGAGLRQGGRTISDGRERHRVRSALIVVQVSLALVLLISSGLMIRTLQAMRHVQPGFSNPESIETFRTYIPETQVREPGRVARMLEEIDRKLAALPGVTSVGITSSVTMDGNVDNDPVFVQDDSEAEHRTPELRRYKWISPGYFRAMGNPLLAGRDITWEDVYQHHPVALISENLARKYWPSPAAALGKKIRDSLNSTWREIIGVAGNELDDGANKPAPLIAYWPILLTGFWSQPETVPRDVAFVIRSDQAGSATFASEVRRAVWSVNPQIPVAELQTVAQIYDKSMARTSFTLVMLAISAGMALLLGVIGIYGVVSYAVSQRTREIGIRVALGASPHAVRRMFVQQALVLVVIGVAAGIAIAAAVTRTMQAVLFETSPLDPLTYAAVSIVIIAAAILASYLPAHRASAVDPAEALRAE